MTDSYHDAFKLAVTELTVLQTQREEIQKQADTLDDRIDKVRQGALGLAALVDMDFEEMKRDYPGLFNEAHDPRLGLTDAVREALRSSEHALSPIDIRDRVLRILPAVAGHKNPMASIHAVLRRLDDNGEIVMGVYEETGRTVYGWVGSQTDKETIKRRLMVYFSNWDVVWGRYGDKWASREEGTPVPPPPPSPKTKQSAAKRVKKTGAESK